MWILFAFFISSNFHTHFWPPFLAPTVKTLAMILLTQRFHLWDGQAVSTARKELGIKGLETLGISWFFPKIGGVFSPKMDGENKGNAYFLMDDLGGFPIFLETPSSFFALELGWQLITKTQVVDVNELFLVAVAVFSIWAVWIMIHKICLQKYQKKNSRNRLQKIHGLCSRIWQQNLV